MDHKNSSVVFSELVKPSFFSEQLNMKLAPMDSILDDFKKNYISHFRNPDYEEYKNLFYRSEGELHTFRSHLFELSNKIDHNKEECIKYLNRLNNKIDSLKTENKKLRREFIHLNQEANTSIERTDNYETIYQIQYLKNWSLLFAIIAASYGTYFVFKPNIIKN